MNYSCFNIGKLLHKLLSTIEFKNIISPYVLHLRIQIWLLRTKLWFVMHSYKEHVYISRKKVFKHVWNMLRWNSGGVKFQFCVKKVHLNLLISISCKNNPYIKKRCIQFWLSPWCTASFRCLKFGFEVRVRSRTIIILCVATRHYNFIY